MTFANLQRCTIMPKLIRERAANGIGLGYIQSDGVRLALWRTEAPMAPHGAPILLLHGATYSTLSVFDLAVPSAARDEYSTVLRLARMGHKVFALDFHGYGASGGITGRADTTLHVAATAVAVAEVTRLTGRRPVLIGWSWSAQVAGRYAAEAPDTIQALIHYGGLWGGGRHGAQIKAHFLRQKLTGERRINTVEHSGADFRTPSAYSPTVRDAFMAFALTVDPTSPNLPIHALQRELPIVDPTRIVIPILVAHGANDHSIIGDDMDEFLALAPAPLKRRAKIPNCDHIAQLNWARGALFQTLGAFASETRDIARAA